MRYGERGCVQRLTRVLADGRARPIPQLMDEVSATHYAVKRALSHLSTVGDVEITIVAGNWLYSTTRFAG